MQSKCYYTEIPNDFIDNSSCLSPIACKVYLIICRKTIGFHRQSDVISNSQLMKMSGINSHHTISKAVVELLGQGFITIKHKGNGRGNKTIYSIAKEANNATFNSHKGGTECPHKR